MIAALTVAAGAAGCQSSTATILPVATVSSPAAPESTPTLEATASAAPSASDVAASASPTPPPSAPAQTPSPSATARSSDATGSPSASVDASPSADAGPGAVCSGSQDNKAFWSSAAASMSWDVYCPVLPGGWYVLNGSYQLTNGGRLEIVYNGPGGAQIRLQEGNFCTAGLSACTPHDTVLGTGAFGDRTGSVDSLGPGMGFAIYIEPGSAQSWAITGTGMDQATFQGIAAALVKVAKS